MALIPLNAFKSVTKKLTTSSELIYETPLTISSIILSAACSNYSSGIVSVTIVIEKPTSPTPTQFYIVPDIEIPPKDVLSAVTGRLVLEQGDKIYAFASSNSSVDFILSLNEAANE
jgi:hypothetical protein